MKRQPTTAKAMEQEPETLIATAKKPIGKGLSIRILTPKGAKAELAIIVGDALTAEELRRAWPRIDGLRTQLRERQGSPMNRIDDALIYGYYEMRMRGKYSFELISQDINYDVLVNLVRAAEEASERNSDPEATKSYYYAYTILKSMRMSDADITAWLADGAAEIRRGHAPWSLDKGPMTADKARDGLRQFTRDVESKKTVVKAPPKTDFVDMKDIAAKNDEFISRANAMLKRDFPKSLKTYTDAVLKKTRENIAS